MSLHPIPVPQKNEKALKPSVILEVEDHTTTPANHMSETQTMISTSQNMAGLTPVLERLLDRLDRMQGLESAPLQQLTESFEKKLILVSENLSQGIKSLIEGLHSQEKKVGTSGLENASIAATSLAPQALATSHSGQLSDKPLVGMESSVDKILTWIRSNDSSKQEYRVLLAEFLNGLNLTDQQATFCLAVAMKKANKTAKKKRKRLRRAAQELKQTI